LQPAAAGSAVKEERTLEDLKVLKHNQRITSEQILELCCAAGIRTAPRGS
jgi:hypothetical protein